jgi:predicted DNA-binding protein
MAVSKRNAKQNVTVRLPKETIRKAKALAAQRSTSISALVAERIEALVGEDEAYERAKRRALALMERGFPTGPKSYITRDELHGR